jgi:hypothetical protein
MAVHASASRACAEPFCSYIVAQSSQYTLLLVTSVCAACVLCVVQGADGLGSYVRHKLAEWDVAAGGTGKCYSMRTQKSGSAGLKYKVCVCVCCTDLHARAQRFIVYVTLLTASTNDTHCTAKRLSNVL